MPQFLRPISRETPNAYVIGDHTDVDEETLDTNDYLEITAGNISQIRFNLSPGNTPDDITLPHKIRFTASTDDRLSSDIIFGLYQGDADGGTDIETVYDYVRDRYGILTFEFTLRQSNVDNITDYSDLNLRLGVGRLNSGTIKIYKFELEIPDSSIGGTTYENKVAVGGNWKNILGTQVATGGSWKQVTKGYIASGGSWKQIKN